MYEDVLIAGEMFEDACHTSCFVVGPCRTIRDDLKPGRITILGFDIMAAVSGKSCGCDCGQRRLRIRSADLELNKLSFPAPTGPPTVGPIEHCARQEGSTVRTLSKMTPAMSVDAHPTPRAVRAPSGLLAAWSQVAC